MLPDHLPCHGMIEEQTRIDALGKIHNEGKSVFLHRGGHRTVAQNPVLLSPFTLFAVVEHHMVLLHIQHTAGYVAASLFRRLIHSDSAVIGDPRILSVQVDRHRKFLKIPVIHPHAIRIILQHKATLLQCIRFQYLSEIFLKIFHGLSVGSFARCILYDSIKKS